MIQQQLIKKKRRLLFLDFNQVEQDEVIKTIKEIREKVRKIFKYHIGRENAINPVDLFTEVFGISPFVIDIFKREYWWNILKATIRQLRKENTCFIINNIHNLYVLKTEEELTKFEKKHNQHILNLENEKMRAKEWVAKKKWQELL
jgi:hypothetical protein